MSNPIIREAIQLAGGVSAVARELGMTAEGVRQWGLRGLPPDWVLWLAQRIDWARTPHQLAPELYPYPDDGLPPERRGDKAA